MKLNYFYTLKALQDGQGKIKMYCGMGVKKQLSGKRSTILHIWRRPRKDLKSQNVVTVISLIHSFFFSFTFWKSCTGLPRVDVSWYNTTDLHIFGIFPLKSVNTLIRMCKRVFKLQMIDCLNNNVILIEFNFLEKAFQVCI